MQPLVYVIVLNYNSRRWIEACVETLLGTRYENFRVIVVDNASGDGSIELVRSRYPKAQALVNERNLGFSEGNNVGISEALANNADYVVLLNPDTKVEPGWLQELITIGEGEAEVGILGAVQLEYDGVEFNSWTKTAMSQFLDELKRPESARAWIPVEWVEGACLAVKRGVFERIGMLDPIYFAFYEEIDFCRRAAASGYKIALVPRSRIHHYRGGSWEANSSIKRERDYRCDRSQFIYASTDPRNSILRNLWWYFVTLGTKFKDALGGFSLLRLFDLIRIQADLAVTSGSIIGKWRRDRARLASAK
ncbi:MAG: glycosyltransferase family 2 protein [Blastocatellales bacterium]